MHISIEKRLIDMCGIQATVTKLKVGPVLRRTDDFVAMKRLALKSGLEEGSYKNYVLAYGYFVGDELVGCAALKLKEDTFTVECLAVSDRFRGMGMGRSLVEVIEREARARYGLLLGHQGSLSTSASRRQAGKTLADPA
jgi:ribosomal protein S18 acetylase RimI-like enzyme